MESIQFSADEFVENLSNEGEDVPCDQTLETFNETKLPAFYDEKLYERGRTFFYENMFGIMNCFIIGGMCIGALPQFVNVLKITNKTNSNLKSYKRFLPTFLYLSIWHDGVDFHPGSRFLTTIASVKKKHNAASNRSIKTLNYRINQANMALTQAALVAFSLVRSSLVGIHNPKEEDLKGFIHIWRIIGSLLGIEDRFNICRESVKETKEICEILINKIFTPLFQNLDNESVELLRYYTNGVSTIYPIIEYDFCMTYLQMLFQNEFNYRKLENRNCRNISFLVKIKVLFILATMNCMKFRIARLCAQYFTKFLFWMATTFPLLAYIRYGVNNGYVNLSKILHTKNYNN